MSSGHPTAEAALRASCTRIAALIGRVGPSGIAERRATLDGNGAFRALVQAISSQQLSTKAAATIFGRIAVLGRDGAFPTPVELLALPETTLRGAGLSGSKVAAVRDLASRVASGSLSLEAMAALSDEEVIDALVEVRGIGRWTAEMFLIFRLGREDVLPVDDLGVKKGMLRLFGLRKLPAPDRMEKLARPWRPYRSVACWYLWRLCEEPQPKPATRQR
jgi:DNA-3-methyladenine glycosylase II